MKKSHNDKLNSNSAAKLTPIRPRLQFGGRAPAEDLRPGDHLVRCVSAWSRPRGKETQAIWQFEIQDGTHRGAALRKWMVIADESGVVSLNGLYATYCQIALARPVTPDDDPADVGAIFSGKTFVVRVAYRRTEHAGGGKPADDQVRKDEKDGLRVHEILRRFE
jgi:hypothetical protein